MEVLTSGIKKLQPLYLVAVLWLAAICIAPVPREFPATVQFSSFDRLFKNYHIFLPALILAFAFLYERSKTHRIWRVLNTRPWINLGYAALAACFTLWIMTDMFNFPSALWGSPLTVGLLTIQILIILDYSKGRIPEPRAWFLATLSAFFCVGLWETLYQVSIWNSWYHSWFSIWYMTEHEILPHYIMSWPLLILLVYYWKINGKTYRFSMWMVFLFLTFAVMWTVWYYIGHYWVILYCDHYQFPPEWVYNDNPINWTFYLLGRSTKVVLTLGTLVLAGGLIHKGVVGESSSGKSSIT